MLPRVLIGLLAATVVSSSALACTVIARPGDVPPPGLNEAELEDFFQRRFYQDERVLQQGHWVDADVVFVAQVRSLRVVDEYQNDARLKPLMVLKGGDHFTARYQRYDTGVGNTCGPDFAYPGIGEVGVFYARLNPWWLRWLPWSRVTIYHVVPVRDVVDQRVPMEMKAAAARLRNARVK